MRTTPALASPKGWVTPQEVAHTRSAGRPSRLGLADVGVARRPCEAHEPRSPRAFVENEANLTIFAKRSLPRPIAPRASCNVLPSGVSFPYNREAAVPLTEAARAGRNQPPRGASSTQKKRWTTSRRRRFALLVAGLVGGPLTTISSAQAAEDDPVVRRSTSRSKLPLADHRPSPGLELRVGRDLMWSRMLLSDELPFTLMSNEDYGAPPRTGVPELMSGIDDRGDLWIGAPRAASSVASIATSLATSGLSLFEVWKDHRLLARHRLRAYVKTTGAKLVWTIDF